MLLDSTQFLIRKEKMVKKPVAEFAQEFFNQHHQLTKVLSSFFSIPRLDESLEDTNKCEYGVQLREKDGLLQLTSVLRVLGLQQNFSQFGVIVRRKEQDV